MNTILLFIKIFTLVLIFAVYKILVKVIDYIGLILKDRAAQTENKMDDQLIPFAIEIGRILVVIFALFFVLGNVFGINITALATGLGIGGIAIAMASKESLENLLGSFTIFFDRPFTVGDVVKVGNVTGLVEKVGFRSTRLKTFDKSVVRHIRCLPQNLNGIYSLSRYYRLQSVYRPADGFLQMDSPFETTRIF